MSDNDAWHRYWIRRLISKRTVMSNTFEEWIAGFEDRYEENILQIMKKTWDSRRYCTKEMNRIRGTQCKGCECDFS